MFTDTDPVLAVKHSSALRSPTTRHERRGSAQRSQYECCGYRRRLYGDRRRSPRWHCVSIALVRHVYGAYERFYSSYCALTTIVWTNRGDHCALIVLPLRRSAFKWSWSYPTK